MKHLLILLLILTGILFSQQLPQYAPGQAIIKLTESAYYDFGTQLLSGALRTSNIELDRLVDNLDIVRVQNILKKDSFDSVEEEIGLNRSFVIYFPAYTDSEIEEAINELKKSYLIEDAFPNALMYELADPNDPFYNQTQQHNLFTIKMSQAWDIQKGSANIRIAILDAGFQPNLPDISPKYYIGRDETDIDANYWINLGYTLDPNEDYFDPDDDPTGEREHGTDAAQIAAAATNNGIGIAGVGWNSPLVLVRCGFQLINSQGFPIGTFETDDVVRALNWVRTSGSAKVINMSFGGVSSPDMQTTINLCLNSGIILVAAAGNTSGAPVMYPAAYPGVIAVSGVDQSNVNTSWNQGPQVSVVAPASNIRTTTLTGSKTGFGTSYSSPMVAGTAALILSQKPDLTPALVKKIIEVTAVKLPGMNGQNFHNYYGYGLLDVYEALRATNSIYTFTNKIMSSDYGSLIIDNDKVNPVQSGSKVPFKYDTPHNSRTNELPFLINYSGTTQKFNRWYTDGSIPPDYNLQLSFTADIESPLIKDANFNATVPATIKNNFTEAGSFDPTTDIIFFYDPWFYYKDGNDNWLQSAEFKPYSSPFNIQNNATDSYGGVFLNQEISSGTYYNIWAGDQQINFGSPIGVRQFYLQNWTSTGANIIPLTLNHQRVVFTSPDASVQANLKGQGLSNSEVAYTNNSQRKLLRTNDGVMYNLYESLNRVWLEKSTDNGATWSIINNGNPLKNADSRNPSMCLTYYNGLIIVFETEGLIWIYEYNPATNIAYERTSIYSCTISPYQSNPVVTYCFNDNASVTGPVVIWKSYGNDAFCGNAGLYYAMINADNWTASPEIIIINTDINSFDPSIAGNDAIHSEATWKGDPMKFNLVWEQRGSVNSSIMFYQVERLANNTLQFTQYQNISSGNGFTKNYKPSLITVKNTQGEFKSRVVWLAERYQAEEEQRTEKGQGTDNTEGAQYKTFFKDVGISGFRSYGNKTNAPTINKLNDNSEYYLAYSEQSNLEGKVVIGSDNTAINDLETIGRDIQMGNGTTENQVRALAFHSADLPFYFNRSASMNHVSPKRKSLAIVSGREGVVGKDTAQFYFTVGDIIVNDENIEFVDLPDTAEINNIVTLNEYLLTNAFTLNDNSVFYYSVQYGITDSASAIQAMTDSIFINFTVQLLDAGTDEIIGTFDNVTYNSDSVFIYNNIAYQVNVSGLNNRLVKLRLKTETNQQFDYSLTQRYAEESVLGKKFIKQINFNAGVAVTEYALDQNYPNPFNPNTTIRYQIPQDGMVTLKVYDILGSEVATLVNEQKAAGRYEVNFDASRLASGVYIYKLQADDYINSKKMLLVK